MGPKNYITCCLAAIGEDITNMVDASKRITRRTFLNHVDKSELSFLERSLGYDQALRMASDPRVCYFKSKYRGDSCVYFDYSAIEYIFI